MVTFNKDIPLICIFNFHTSNLYSGSTLTLESSDCLSIFTNDQSNGVIWYWNNESLTGRQSKWSQHRLIIWCIWHHRSRVVQLLGNHELLMTDLLPSIIISRYDPIDCSLGTLHTLRVLTYDQYMLLILIIRLWSCILFLRVFASD